MVPKHGIPSTDQLKKLANEKEDNKEIAHQTSERWEIGLFGMGQKSKESPADILISPSLESLLSAKNCGCSFLVSLMMKKKQRKTINTNSKTAAIDFCPK